MKPGREAATTRIAGLRTRRARRRVLLLGGPAGASSVVRQARGSGTITTAKPAVVDVAFDDGGDPVFEPQVGLGSPDSRALDKARARDHNGP